MNALENVLSRLRSVQSHGDYYTACCPAHDDQHRSLSLRTQASGRISLKCFAGCSRRDILSALSLAFSDLAPGDDSEKVGHREIGRRGQVSGKTPPATLSTEQHSVTDRGSGCTLTEYAVLKALPVGFLQSVGLSDYTYLRQPAVRIPYFDDDGTESCVRYRIALRKTEYGDDRFRWRKGSKPTLYGVHRLEAARIAGYLLLVEGESDCQVAWYHDVPAAGIPGANNWKEEWAPKLEGIPIIYLVIEPDRGGDALLRHFCASSLRDRVRLVCLPDAKDIAELYLRDPDNFRTHLNEALEASVPLSDWIKSTTEARRQDIWVECEALASERDILACFAQTCERRGVVGVARVLKLLYLIITSRILTRPVSAVLKGPSSGGKSFVVEQALKFFPISAYHTLSAMSDRVLAYSNEPLSHRILVIYEAAGMASELATYLIRSLLSEGCIRYETIEKTKEGLCAKLIEREGPTGLIVTTTAASLHPENETRLLSIPIIDTPEQTRNILRALAHEGRNGIAPDDGELETWHAFQEWLMEAEHEVTIPFAGALSELVPPRAVRLRRDFGMMLNLVRTHATLHQVTRPRDESGLIVAALEDYAAVRELIADLVAEGVEATVPVTVRETVEAVADLHRPDGPGVSISQVALHLKLDKSAISRRAKVAITRGYLENLETLKGRPARLKVGEPLPAEEEILPTVARLQEKMKELERCCTVDSVSGTVESSSPRQSPSEVRY